MTRPRFVLALFAAALICFIVAWLLAIDRIFHGGNYPAWVAGGLAFLAAAFLAQRAP